MKLHELQPASGAHRPKRRKGIGIAAGQGKTGGRGQKGQKSRSGGVKRGYFEGGQLPLVRKLPFARGVGFNSPFRIDYTPVNVGQLAMAFQAGGEATPETMAEAGLVDKGEKYIAILGEGDINVPLKVTAHKFSAVAKSKIEQAGGTIEQIKVVRGGYRTR
ncbi:MAG: 50S ribosomal protein L15 [Anaerolineae bacterium]|nr:50S ribosomal protein L15 [Thermoflexales bacterium]MDW8408452.1 50S ribosomal protein L15 [Anaerolineae bacterium]